MARLLALPLLLWAFFLGPALCMGGLLDHACDCVEEIDCEHEESCAEDPCFEAVPAGGRSFDFEQQALCELALPASFTSALTSKHCTRRVTRSPRPPDRLGLACAPSDRPLRI